LHGFIEPFPPFIIMNFFGTIAPLISMSLRIFGNITAGGVIMTLFYAFTGFLSSTIPMIGGFDFVGVIAAPIFHAYFDVFAGFIQTYIFIMLTTIFIGNELPQE
jgi:F-type H+-transporting ATPase subunit a